MIGTTVSHYKILEKLGEGGMGVVYKALDTKLNRTVALKFLPSKTVQNEEEKRRITREAQAAASLNHPNIATVYEINQADDNTFIAMEYVEGQSLDVTIRSPYGTPMARGDGQGGPLDDNGEQFGPQPLPINQAVEIAIQIAEGLQVAHGKEVIHRDIKPSNVMITVSGRVKLMDFGLVKMRDVSLLTKEGTTLGTVPYMSPEQARGEVVDHRTDIWSLGVLLYELITGQRPFRSDYEQALIYLIVNEDHEPLRKYKPDISPELVRIINRMLEKNKEDRYPSTAELLNDLEKYRESLRQEELGVLNIRTVFRWLRRPQIAFPAAAVILIVILLALWYFNRQANVRWAREEALPQMEQYILSWQFTDAYKIGEKAEKYIRKDPLFIRLFSMCSFPINVDTDPHGAHVYIKEYGEPNSEWNYLGVSPLEGIRLPIGVFRWKIEKEGYETVLAAASTWDVSVGGESPLVPHHFMRTLDEKGTIPQGMVRVAGAQTPVGILNDFFIDQYEVTNRQYKEFIDNGGYRDTTYWVHEIVKDGTILTWEEAMSEFVDQSGRPGPSTWLAGHYPEGQADYPVSGVSWYEAAAYAEYAGKKLPTVYHWGLARGEQDPLLKWPQLGGFATFAPFSNFGGRGLVPVGNSQGITSYGAFDLAGNVREWCWNESDRGRIIRGGAWDDPPYMFTYWSQVPPFDRSSKNGFRCVFYEHPDSIPESAFQKAIYTDIPDFTKVEPVSDAVFEVYKDQFSYDSMPLNSRVEIRDESSNEWIQEKITYTAAYGNERMAAYLFLPKNVQPPYQTVVYFPGSNAAFSNSSENLPAFIEFPVFVDFLIKGGRAVLFPVYKGTFERQDDALGFIHYPDETYQFTQYFRMIVQDFKRSIDYLETREDIDAAKIAYYGMSWGGYLGAIIPAIEDRLSVNIVLSGGFNGRGRPEANQLNYVTRVTIPTLMINGRYDSLFPYETSIRPMFDLLGASDKELKLYETDHIPPRTEFIKEILNWLDEYFGPVR